MPLKVRGPSLPSVSGPARPWRLSMSSCERLQRRVRFDQQAERAARDEGDRHEVFLRVVGQGLEQVAGWSPARPWSRSRSCCRRPARAPRPARRSCSGRRACSRSRPAGPKPCASRSRQERATLSGPEPGGCDSTHLTGLSGQVCARRPAHRARARALVSASVKWRRCMVRSPGLGVSWSAQRGTAPAPAGPACLARRPRCR